METLGFVFGMSGMSFAIIAWGQIASLKKEFKALKKNLEDSGVLKEQAKPKDKIDDVAILAIGIGLAMSDFPF